MPRETSFAAPVLICVLGTFRVIARGRAIRLKPGGKAQLLLERLALETRQGVAREQVLETLWPDADLGLAGQNLNTLVYSLHRALGPALGGQSPVRYADGTYRLNADRGVSVDIGAFEEAADHGDRAARAGDDKTALASYRAAKAVYLGDLVPTSDVRHLMERERLRGRYLAVLGRLAELRFNEGDLEGALSTTLDVIARDPCREDAHRLAMRAYNRLGQRSQALRQYRLCADVLQAEFDAVPEPATDELYAQLRIEPSRV
jgi:DNA-binding SARP family transcriptional activator